MGTIADEPLEFRLEVPGGLGSLLARFERTDSGERCDELFNHPQDVIAPDHGIRSNRRERPVEDRQADDFRPGHMRSMPDAFGRMEERARGVRHTGFLPFTGEHVSLFIGDWVGVRRDRVAGLELVQHDYAVGVFMFVQHQQLDAFIRPGLPGFVFAQRDVGKHAFIQTHYRRFASAERRLRIV